MVGFTTGLTWTRRLNVPVNAYGKDDVVWLLVLKREKP
jgi:hypothetical protein